ncbi:helix-turn-helix domain-containing protein [Streptomyces millisiae]|uniref:Helix-turn-helix transcriptional regulator n=1 Tax=Streptomyces millisiae TaxID=3075542 RepID=A0ABU2LQZ8_9ACTN|nr:helix-turn-helix transcriptional regulator [Streptomyces sp. DSM 44918]MDT0319647.1 helix-turn-helix transcriptional regulator [Streptomyces sp. DSM 44918]
MPQRKPISGRPSVSPRRMLRIEVARLREESGRSLRQLAEKVGYDHTQLGRVESGKSLGGPELIEALDTLYGTTPHLSILWELALAKGKFRDKYQRVLELEAQAAVIEQYVSLIPGLFQTEAYARALLFSAPHGPEDIPELEEQLDARLGRQELLRRDPAPLVRMVLDEAALRRALPDPTEWREQLARLLELAAEPHVVIQVLPYSAGLLELIGESLLLLRTADGETTAWLEGAKNGELFDVAEDVEDLRLSYDAVRDLALSSRESVTFIEQLMETLPCDPLEST